MLCQNDFAAEDVYFDAVQGTTYYFQIGMDEVEGNFRFTVLNAEFPGSGDSCANAEVIESDIPYLRTVPNGTAVGTCLGSTDDYWFSWTPVVSGPYFITTYGHGAEITGQIGVWESCSPTGQIGCGATNYALDAVAGRTYYFQLG